MIGLFWSAVAVALVFIVVGTVLWLPTRKKKASRGELGAGFFTAVATSAVVSLMFFSLTLRADDKQKALSEASQRQQQRLSNKLQVQLARENKASEQQQARLSRTLQLALVSTLSGADLRSQPLVAHDLSYKNLSGADLTAADLFGAQLNSSNLSGAILSNTNLAHAYMRYANLNGAQLVGANLANAYLDEAQLANANFGVNFPSPGKVALLDYATWSTLGTPANLSYAQLQDAQMRGDCLAQANLYKARLGGANLAGADLDGANLTRASLSFAGLPVNLTGASLWGAKYPARDRPYLKHIAVVTSAMRRILRRGVAVPAHARTGHISHMFDGDTAYISHLGWIRVLGLTAPNHDWPDGQGALHFFERFFDPSDTVRYVLGTPAREPRWKTGNTGRYLVYLWNTSGDFLNQALLQRGFAARGVPAGEANNPTPARIDAGGSRYSKVLDTAVAFAKDTGRGVWSICPKFLN